MARKVSKIDNSYNKYSPEVVARPVDTYVTPARDTGDASEYRSLAGALAGIHDPLAKFAERQAKERDLTFLKPEHSIRHVEQKSHRDVQARSYSAFLPQL